MVALPRRCGGAEEIAAAKIRVGQSARVGAEHCRPIHGAIGLAQDYRLKLAMRRLRAWREEFEDEAFFGPIAELDPSTG